MPTYDRRQLVQRALRTIIESGAAVADAVEIIVSDNSPDVSEAACRAALAGWPGRSVYLGNRPDIGAVANFNQCISRATGEYVLFVHDDDRLLPEAIPAILESIRDASHPVMLFGIHIVDEAREIVRRQEFCRAAMIGPGPALQCLLSDNGLAWFPGLVVSREAYAAAGPFDDAAGNTTDLDMWVRLFARFGMRCVPKAISVYSVHADSATQTTAFDSEAIARITTIFDHARATGVLSRQAIDRCQADFLPQVILGTAAFDLRSGRMPRARQVLGLFELPSVRALRPSFAWRAVRVTFVVLVRTPSAVVRQLMTAIDRLDLVRRVRASTTRGGSTLPLC